MPQPNQNTKRTILYYPTISIPDTSWLRQALLYWDEIGSIVPQMGNETLLLLTPEIEYLRAEGVFRPFNPETLIKRPDGWEVLQEFEKEFKDIIKTDSFQRLIGHQKKLNSLVHHDKVGGELFDDFLQAEGLAATNSNDPEWYLFEEKTALLYMSLLAKYLSDIDIQVTFPGTDRPEYEGLIFKTSSMHQGFSCLDTRFNNVLPIPREDIALSDILHFKSKRHAELLSFRALLDEFQQSLSKSEDVRQIKDVLLKFKDKLEKGVSDLDALLRDSSISTLVGTLKTIVNVKSPTLIGAIGVSAGYVTKIAELPIEWTVAGLGTMGLVEIGSHLIHKRNEKRATLRGSGFAYLYRASTEGLL